MRADRFFPGRGTQEDKWRCCVVGVGGVLGVGKDENNDKHVGPKCAGQDPGASSEGRSRAAGGPPIRRPGRGHLEGILALSLA